MLLRRLPSSVPLVRTAQRPGWSGGRLPRPGFGLSGGGTTEERAGIEEYGFEGKEIGLYASFAASLPWLCGVVPVKSLELLSRSRHGDAEFIFFHVQPRRRERGICAKKEEEEGGKLCQSSKVRFFSPFFAVGGRRRREGRENYSPPPYHIYWFVAQKWTC